MVKIQLVASAALMLCASVCSALDLYTDYRYQGNLCRIETLSGTCVGIPEECSGRVLSVQIHQGWVCQFYPGVCGGVSHDIRRDTPAIEDPNLKFVTCWNNWYNSSSSIEGPHQALSIECMDGYTQLGELGGEPRKAPTPDPQI
ncbi:hypothetical protein B0O80DRAFT_430736 [Mortierella sp. GBAus27b]|nr:hypothetical protein B0O80DRAFT_430736 [Mortierella sp. GBAus27b]